MRDEFTTRLRAETSRLADTITPRPAPEIRRRGDQRRRRAAATSAVLAAAVLTAGGVSAYAASGHLGKAGPVTHASPSPRHHTPPVPGAGWAGAQNDLSAVSCAGLRDCWGAGI